MGVNSANLDQQTMFSGIFGRRDSGLRQLEANRVKYVGVVDAVGGVYFSTLGVKPLMGRLISASDVHLQRGSNPVAVLNSRCWKENYGGSQDVLGKDAWHLAKLWISIDIWIVVKPALSKTSDAATIMVQFRQLPKPGRSTLAC